MCGIAGIFDLEGRAPVSEQDIRQMLGMIRHRGPDEFGIYIDDSVALGSARLRIVDLSGGQQPVSNEDGTLWIVFNGEIFNFVEMRGELKALGHRFATNSDTEVVVHAFEEFGPKCLERLNGQFAFAIWDVKSKSLFLARDRLGVRPLFYALRQGMLIFGSEIKAILSDPRVIAEIDLAALDQVFTFWCPLSPRTVFQNIFEVPPGHYLKAHESGLKLNCYWEVAFPESHEDSSDGCPRKAIEDVEQEFCEILIDAVKIRLRADVPVGAYLSGGLDSSIIASIVRDVVGNKLRTFSIAFDDSDFDESSWQRKVADYLGTSHQVVHATHADIREVFPKVIWHTEVPLVRTGPAPMFLLSKLVRDSGYKVVLTGEGADEFLAGYDIFKEAKIRRFWASQPDSKWRPLLLKRLYPDIGNLSKTNASFLAAFFGHDLANLESSDYSHSVRWRNSGRNSRFFSQDVACQLVKARANGIEGQLSPKFNRWDALARAQYLEIKVFLSQYLLSSQGDRMAMAHSVEGRFPFLDWRVVQFCNRLPSNLKLRGLTEKYLLKKVGKRWLPREICQRPKRPYRSPIHRSFINQSTPGYVEDLLSPQKIKATGLFKSEAVSQLVQKIRLGKHVGETDDMALAGILSTQLFHSQFISEFRRAKPLSENDDVKLCARQHPGQRG